MPAANFRTFRANLVLADEVIPWVEMGDLLSLPLGLRRPLCRFLLLHLRTALLAPENVLQCSDRARDSVTERGAG